MPDLTSKLALAKPRGGSSGSSPAEQVDIDVLNGNFDKIDDAVGAAIRTSTTRPSAPFPGQFSYDADTTGVYLWDGSTWVNSLGDSGWINETSAGGNTPNAQYRRKNGIVFIRGSHVPTNDSQILFNLPGGFRPARTLTFWQERGGSSGPAAKIEVQGGTSGSVIFRNGGSGAIQFALSFIADQ